MLESKRDLAGDEADIRVADGKRVFAIVVGVIHLSLTYGLLLKLNNIYCVPSFCKNIISISVLDSECFNFTIDNGIFKIFRNNVLYGNPCLINGLYVLKTGDINDRAINNVNAKRLKVNDSSETRLWHFRLGHISEKRLSSLHKCGLLSQFRFEQIDRCESCLMGKMTKSPFTGKGERASDLLGLIHSNVCGPMSTQARKWFRYFITFTDDFSRFGYVYLMRHKSESFDKFKEFKAEAENQLGKKVKALRPDRGGEYLAQDFIDHLQESRILSEWTPPGTPQLNGVSERRNRTLLDMVRSMMSQTDLPISFWGHAHETAAFILNREPTKSVETTPYQVWNGKTPLLSFIKIWGCGAYVKRLMADKLEPRSDK